MTELQDFPLVLAPQENFNPRMVDCCTVAGHLESILIHLGETLRSFRVDSGRRFVEGKLEEMTRLYATAAKHNNNLNMSKDRKLWSSNRPSLRCQPL